MRYIKIHPDDNVAVAIEGGQVPAGHKIALADIRRGERVIKYGFPIGVAQADIKCGEWVHSHNLKTALGAAAEYSYKPSVKPVRHEDGGRFWGWLRSDGRAGIRNEIWVLPTVGCVNKAAEEIARRAQAFYPETYAFAHPYGCSQLGDDLATTQTMLAALCRHPNAGAVLVLGLGCENNNIRQFKKALGDYDGARVKFLNCQEVTDEIEEGVEILRLLAQYAGGLRKSAIPFSKLTVGLKCGGSDGYSGITANPLVGRVCDRLVARGSSTVLTEVPEMFGAETILFERCADIDVFNRAAEMVNSFKDYFISHGQPVYENPSPGNKEGGITTLEEKSLGCVQKGGSAPVTDVLKIGESVRKPGLNLLYGPGNDIVAVTALACAGCQMILFTTGRGTPLGAPVPTIKIATNSALAAAKPSWIDFNAGSLLEGDTMDSLEEKLTGLMAEVASGVRTRNEVNGFREIALFKDGVTL